MFPLHEAILDLLEIYHVNGQEHATLYIKQLEMSSPEDIGALWAVLAALTLGVQNGETTRASRKPGQPMHISMCGE